MPYLVKSSMADQPPELQIDELRLPAPDARWADLRDNNVDVKIWLPDGVKAAADELAKQYEHSLTVILRNALIIHVYGRANFDRLVMSGELRAPRGYVPQVISIKQLRVHLGADPCDPDAFPPEADPRAAQAVRRGKPVNGVRLYMPAQLERDLAKLAERAGKPISEYCREVLTAYFLGELLCSDLASTEPKARNTPSAAMAADTQWVGGPDRRGT